MKQRILSLIIVFLIGMPSAQAQQRVALVIGNQLYANAPRLDGAAHDAQAIAKALRKLEFLVDERPNLDLSGMRRALREFEGKANGAAVALVYYAGHGMQLTRGVAGDNYLLPTDAKLQDARDVEDETVALSRMLERLEGAKSRVVILDACRDNPLASQMRNLRADRSVGRGLAPLVGSDRGTLVVFSTAPGWTAADDVGGGNGPFATSLLRHLSTPGLEVRHMLTRVRAETSQLTNGRQVPWSNDGLFEEVYIAGRASDPIDLAFWQSIQGSRNRADFEAYLARYPQGLFAVLAINRLAEMAGAGPALVTKPAATTAVAQASHLQQSLRPPAPTDECDRLAQPLRSSMGRVPSFAEGVEFSRLDGSAALAACERAAERYPEEPRFIFLRGRALERLDRKTEAAETYRRAADQGSAPAQFRLGEHYEYGQGVSRNSAEAMLLYRRASEQGYALALSKLGEKHLFGRDVAQSIEEAVRLYLLAAEQGDLDALSVISLIGSYYTDGRGGVAQNYIEAVRLYRLAADRGNASAQLNLGRMYELGHGVAQDSSEAVRHYRRAADQGYAIAQVKLGEMYDGGVGVAQDPAEAVRLYRLAADAGNSSGQTNLAWMHENGRGVRQNTDEAIRLYRLAARKGVPRAQDAMRRFNLDW